VTSGSSWLISEDTLMSGLILETERLSLREITANDVGDLLEIWGDPETMRLFPRTLDQHGMREWIERNQKRYEQYGHGLWAVRLRGEQKLIGDCGLVIQDVDGIEELEVGYHFNKNYWGRGFAAEAARACMDYAFERLGRRRVISMIRPENEPSRRVAERNGLRIEKEILWRGYQHYVYSIDAYAINRERQRERQQERQNVVLAEDAT
jgi:RimJ/RimL family protein N-acetyltransferase